MRLLLTLIVSICVPAVLAQNSDQSKAQAQQLNTPMDQVRSHLVAAKEKNLDRLEIFNPGDLSA